MKRHTAAGLCAILFLLLAIAGLYFIFWFGSILLNEFKWWQPPTMLIILAVEFILIMAFKYAGDQYFNENP